jgi:5'-nucleotidase
MPGWQNLRPSTTVEVAGLPIGLVGVTTRATPRSTLPSNFAGLAVTALEEAIVREARRLRAEGVRAVVVLAHEGGRCREFRDPEDLSSCEAGSEIFEVARRLPAGLVDVIVAGHTHQGIAHVVNGVAIVESFAEGRAFGRVDLVFDGRTRRVRALRVHPPRPLCGPGRPARGRGGGLRAAAVRGRARRSGRRHRRPGRPGA